MRARQYKVQQFNDARFSSITCCNTAISGVTGGGRGAECPQRLLTGKFLLTYQEKRGKGKGVKI